MKHRSKPAAVSKPASSDSDATPRVKDVVPMWPRLLKALLFIGAVIGLWTLRLALSPQLSQPWQMQVSLPLANASLHNQLFELASKGSAQVSGLES